MLPVSPRQPEPVNTANVNGLMKSGEASLCMGSLQTGTARYEKERLALDDMLYASMVNNPKDLLDSLANGARPNNAKDMSGDPVPGGDRDSSRPVGLSRTVLRPTA